MRAYYASKLSENISQTDEGYLICLNVPIARVGTQKYLLSELGIEPPEGMTGDSLVPVFRSEEEVFDPKAMASFEAKPTTNEHPPDNVTIDNASRLSKGFCKDVRRGTGDDADKLIADLIFNDPVLINEIMNGKRGISCGYNCDYEFDADGIIHQRTIRGNHVAVVTAGRAGSDVAIHDNAPALPELPEATAEPEPQPINPTIKRRRPHMSKTKQKTQGKGGVIGRLYSVFSKDADPEEVAEIVAELVDAFDESGADEAAIPEAPVAAKRDEAASDEPLEEQTPHWAKDILDRLGAVEDCIKGMQKSDDSDPLEELEKELAGDEGEESVEAAAEILGDEAEDEAVDESVDEDPIGVGVHQKDSHAQVLASIRAAKPVIAAIKDPAQRKQVSDSMAKVLRASMGIPGTGGKSYAKILDTKQAAAKGHKTKDTAADEKRERAAKLGEELAKKHNPHYREKK